MKHQPKAGIRPLTVHCPACAALAINNVACHETGCHLAKYPWKREGTKLVPDPHFVGEDDDA